VVGALRHRRHRARGQDAGGGLHRGVCLRRLWLGMDRTCSSPFWFPWAWRSSTAMPRSTSAATRWSRALPSTCWRQASPWCSATPGSRKAAARPSLPPEGRFLPLDIPGVSALADVPVLGFLAKVFLSHSIITYVAIILVPLTAWALSARAFGLRLRAVGENPHAVDTAGISVAWLRYRAVIIAGVLCGMAGAFISTSLSSSFVRDMTAGGGFMALAALIFANWRPWRALFACLLFGFLQASGNYLQGVPLAACRSRCSSSTCCPMCSPWCCSRASSASR
jgi:hypothetical protein